jgi:hypothetical protein
MKKTSGMIAISFGVNESAANTFTEEEIALQLDVLSNEVFVVLAVDLNPSAPEMITGVNTETQAMITTTTQTALQSLANSNTVAVASLGIQSDVTQAVGFTRGAQESYQGALDYLSIIATNNFFVSVKGTGNTAARNVTGRLWGYRARADSSTYAALVQSEVLSA